MGIIKKTSKIYPDWRGDLDGDNYTATFEHYELQVSWVNERGWHFYVWVDSVLIDTGCCNTKSVMGAKRMATAAMRKHKNIFVHA